MHSRGFWRTQYRSVLGDGVMLSEEMAQHLIGVTQRHSSGILRVRGITAAVHLRLPRINSFVFRDLIRSSLMSTNCVLIYLFIYVYAPGYHHRNNHRRLRHTTLTTTVTPPEDTPARYQGPQSTALNQIRQRRTPLISKKSLSYVVCPLAVHDLQGIGARCMCMEGGRRGEESVPCVGAGAESVWLALRPARDEGVARRLNHKWFIRP